MGAQEPSDYARVLATVLSCSPQAVATHRTAAWLWGLVDRLDPIVDLVLLDGRNPGGRPGIRVHRPRVLTPRLVRWRHGVPVTCATDTLLDLAGVQPPDELEASCALALSKGLTTHPRLMAAVNDSKPRPGIGQLRRLVSSEAGPTLTRSRNERLMRRLVQQAELPPPSLNVVVWGKEVDLYWPEAKLAVEVDAFGTHGAPTAFEADRRR